LPPVFLYPSTFTAEFLWLWFSCGLSLKPACKEDSEVVERITWWLAECGCSVASGRVSLCVNWFMKFLLPFQFLNETRSSTNDFLIWSEFQVQDKSAGTVNFWWFEMMM
jgi:hypothetical protein